MGILNNTEISDVGKLNKEFNDILADFEEIIKAYKMIRDLVLLTTHRLILIDKLGVTGRKSNILSIPYSRINKYSCENAVYADLDAEVRIYLAGEKNPLEFTIERGAKHINEFNKILSTYLLK